MKLKKAWLAPALILALAAFKYFYQALIINPMEVDQEFLSLEAWKILIQHKLTLIGAPTSVGSIFIGPFYTYFIAAVMAVTRLHPASVNWVSALWASITPLALYFIGRKIFSAPVGFIAGLLAALSPNFLHLDIVPPLVIPLSLVSLLAFYTLSQIKASRKMILVSAFLIGLSLHLHFTGLYSLIVFIIWLLLTRTKLTIKEIIQIAAIWLSFLLPLFAFDLRHQFLNSRNFISFFTTKPNTHFSLIPFQASLHIALSDLGSLLTNIKTYNLTLGIAVFVLFILFLLLKKPKQSNYYLLALWFIFPIIANGFYSGRLLPYYFIFHQPQIFLILGLLLEPLTWSLATRILLAISSLIYLSLTFSWLKSWNNGFSLNHKMAAFEFITSRADPQKVNLSLSIEPARHGGMDYLRLYYGFDDKLDLNRPTYTIVLPSNWHRIKSDFVSGDVGVVLPQQP